MGKDLFATVKYFSLYIWAPKTAITSTTLNYLTLFFHLANTIDIKLYSLINYRWNAVILEAQARMLHNLISASEVAMA